MSLRDKLRLSRDPRLQKAIALVKKIWQEKNRGHPWGVPSRQNRYGGKYYRMVRRNPKASVKYYAGQHKAGLMRMRNLKKKMNRFYQWKNKWKY